MARASHCSEDTPQETFVQAEVLPRPRLGRHLTEEERQQVYGLWKTRQATQAELAVHFQVTERTINEIIRRAKTGEPFRKPYAGRVKE